MLPMDPMEVSSAQRVARKCRWSQTLGHPETGMLTINQNGPTDNSTPMQHAKTLSTIIRKEPGFAVCSAIALTIRLTHSRDL